MAKPDIRLASSNPGDFKGGGGYNGGNSGSGGPPDMEARIARLESDVHHMSKTLDEVKLDVRDVRNNARGDFRWLLGIMIGTAATLGGLLAKGFGWL